MASEWQTVFAEHGEQRFTGTVVRTAALPSDPRDGDYWTYVAEARVESPSGTAVVATGFATDRTPSQHTLDRAVGEALERGIWELHHGMSGAHARPNGETTEGAAVHVSHEAATEAASQEALEKDLARHRFDLRNLGAMVRGHEGSGPNPHVAVWHHAESGLVVAGQFGLAETPPIVLTSAWAGMPEKLESAIDHSLAELAQVKPWLRTLSDPRRASDSHASVASRVRWWTTAEPARISKIWDELTRQRREALDAEPRERVDAATSLSHAAVVEIGGRELYFARAERAAPYSVGKAQFVEFDAELPPYPYY